MKQTASLAAYCRISVDEELDRENTSIENQKAIIQDFVAKKFPGSGISFFEDRDRSGYTFEQREGYQKMRPLLMSRRFDVLIVKDFSRFARRNSRGLVELEDLRDAGVRIISIGDSIDYPTYDDWTAIQFRFLINEMPVTDTSKKVKNVIKRRQSDGKWICAVPYGYVITNTKTMQFEPDEPAAEIVRKVFQLYNDGWGYKKIANHLTDLHIPTPRQAEKTRKEEQGEETKRQIKPEWSIITIQGILENDFYIGTLRQGKYTRKKINGADVKKDEADHLIFENHHEAILDYRTFAVAQEQRKQRSTTNYRGIKVHDNAYSGFLFCGDCGAPMFSMSRRDLKPAYTCGTYHRRGLKGCTSHHTRVDSLDGLLKQYVKKIQENSAGMLNQLNESLKKESIEGKNNEETSAILERQLNDAYEELKATKRQRVRDVMKHPEKEELLEQTYDELEAEQEDRITGLKNQIALTADKRNSIIRVNRVAKTAMDIFSDILKKPKLDKVDLDLMIEKIMVYEDRLEIKLKADVDALLRCDSLADAMEAVGSSTDTVKDSQFSPGNPLPLPAHAAVCILAKDGAHTPSFPPDTADSAKTASRAGQGSREAILIQSARNKPDKVYCVNVISSGDALEIFTDAQGGVIFKKYSPVGELSTFAAQYADVLSKTANMPTLVCDRDHVVAAAGVSRKEFLERRVSPALEEYMQNRHTFVNRGGTAVNPVEGVDRAASIIYPIIAQSDVSGAVVMLQGENGEPGETETKLAQAAASFLGKQLEE